MQLDNQLLYTLPLQIAERLGARIVEGVLGGGERLKEVEIAQGFGVSRATVREALRILELRGLVTISPQRGAQVTALSKSELENLFEIRAALLALASSRAAREIKESSLPRLDAALDDLARSVRDPTAYVRASGAMVSLIAELSGNPQLAEMIESFALRIGRYVRLGLAKQTRRNQSLQQWREIVAAIKGRRADEAGELHKQLALGNLSAGLAALHEEAQASTGAAGRKK